MPWLEALNQHRRHNQACVVVLITRVQGSAPRNVGTRMVVSDAGVTDTIGGGALEMEAISHARALLSMPDSHAMVSTHTFLLGAELSQCCGGKVTLQFDCHRSNSFRVHIFGAGHVAQELARILERLPCIACFHDPRQAWLDRLPNTANIHKNRLADNSFSAVEACEPNAFYLVMTHSHELDQDVVEAILSRSDARYCGLIASKSKALKFRLRLKKKGFTERELLQLTAPIGVNVDTGNTPMEVAVAAVADMLTILQSVLVSTTTNNA